MSETTLSRIEIESDFSLRGKPFWYSKLLEYIAKDKEGVMCNFEGGDVAASLKHYEDLWVDLFYDGETLYIVGSGVADKLLERIAKSWSPDELDWLIEKESRVLFGERFLKKRILSAWWD